MTRALVTGAGGFVGQHLCARLVGEGWEVWGTVRPGAPAPAGVHPLPVDLTAPYEVPDVDVAFHLAAARSKATTADRIGTASVNALSGLHLVEALPASCRAVVRVGSSTEYAEVDGPMGEDAPLRPRGFFGATKAAGSLLLTAAAAERGIRSAVLRAFQVYGAYDKPTRFVPTVLRAAASGEVLPLTAPGLRRDWVHVDDVVQACLLAAAADALPAGQVLNIGTGVQTANEELVALAAEVTGRGIRTSVGAHAGRSWDASSWVADPALARVLLGWEPRLDLRAGLARTWAAT
ncbi:MAG: strE [Frankiales bacterium]|nr:strE [Frankiales bacterium]